MNQKSIFGQEKNQDNQASCANKRCLWVKLLTWPWQSGLPFESNLYRPVLGANINKLANLTPSFWIPFYGLLRTNGNCTENSISLNFPQLLKPPHKCFFISNWGEERTLWFPVATKQQNWVVSHCSCFFFATNMFWALYFLQLASSWSS